jgi:S1-C subfamily serine protease
VKEAAPKEERRQPERRVSPVPRPAASGREEPSEAPRRRPARPRDEDEEELPPRKEKKGSLLLPLLLIGGGVGALLLLLGVGGVGALWYLRSAKASAQKQADGAQANVVAEEEAKGKAPDREGEKPGPQEKVVEPPKQPDKVVLPAEMAAETLGKIKQSTVMLRVDLPTGGKAEGTGFFVHAPGIIVTNAHVLGMLGDNSEAPKSVEVAVHSGELNETRHKGLVLGVDRTNDLAVLRIAAAAPLPEPLKLDATGQLLETQKVYIFGFPYGSELGKNITVSQSSISSLRRDEVGGLKQIQVNGGMHPGNSGGPVTDTGGTVIGVSVAIIQGTQINFAIPGAAVKQVLDGRITGSEFGTPFASGSETRLPVRLATLDPLNRARDVKVEVWAGNPGKPRPAGLRAPTPQPGDGVRQTRLLQVLTPVGSG